MIHLKFACLPNSCNKLDTDRQGNNDKRLAIRSTSSKNMDAAWWIA